MDKFNQFYEQFNPWIVGFSATSYIFMVFIGPWLMSNRKPFNLLPLLCMWNLLLSAASLISLLLLWPYTWAAFQLHPCAPTPDDRTSFILSILFTYSKHLEFIDTLFLVLRKKKIIFLHWFHHLLTMIAANVWQLNIPPNDSTLKIGHVGMTINCGIHFIMYLYYALSTIKTFRIPRYVNIVITLAQFSQMCFVFGMILRICVICGMEKLHWNVVLFMMAMYACYIVLFGHFLLNTYCWKKKTLKLA